MNADEAMAEVERLANNLEQVCDERAPATDYILRDAERGLIHAVRAYATEVRAATTETPPAPTCRHGNPEASCWACDSCAACGGSCGTCPYDPTPPAARDTGEGYRRPATGDAEVQPGDSAACGCVLGDELQTALDAVEPAAWDETIRGLNSLIWLLKRADREAFGRRIPALTEVQHLPPHDFPPLPPEAALADRRTGEAPGYPNDGIELVEEG